MFRRQLRDDSVLLLQLVMIRNVRWAHHVPGVCIPSAGLPRPAPSPLRLGLGLGGLGSVLGRFDLPLAPPHWNEKNLKP